MLTRLYAHRYRCLENFEFQPEGEHSVLLLGKNGAGKSTLKAVLALFQAIGRGQSRIRDLLNESDFTLYRTDAPMRFEIEALVNKKIHYRYQLAFDFPAGFRELRLLQESLSANGEIIFERALAEVTLHRPADKAEFSMDWHLLAMPVVQDRAGSTLVQDFRHYLSRMALLSPLPTLMHGQTQRVPQPIDHTASNLVDWLADLLESDPPAYSTVMDCLNTVMPDLELFRFEKLGRDTRLLLVRFKSDASHAELPFATLSDGEKSFFLWATLLAYQRWKGGFLTFWDEPDNYLALSEIQDFVVALKRNALKHGGQLIATSHNAQAASCFTTESTWVLQRRSHLEPTTLRNLSEVESQQKHQSSVIDRLISGELL